MLDASLEASAPVNVAAHLPRVAREQPDAPAIWALRFVQDVPLHRGDRGWHILEETARKLPSLAHLPALICWGDQDFAFDLAFLREWRKYLPDAEVIRFPDASHYVLEDAADEVIALVERFIAGPPPPARA